MSTRGQQQPYHHGDLKRSLVEAGVELLEREGLAALSLRAAARAAGVSHNAPYSHFESQNAFAAAIAAHGLRELAAAMRRRRDAADDPVKRLQLAGVAYVAYALRHPHMFRLMFGQFTGAVEYDELREEGGETVAVLREAVDACIRGGAFGPDVDPRVLSVSAWSLTHGLALLSIDRQIGRNRSARALERQAEEVTGLFLSALAERGARHRS